MLALFKYSADLMILLKFDESKLVDPISTPILGQKLDDDVKGMVRATGPHVVCR